MTAPADLARRAREAASSSESVRERLSELITLAAEARRLEDPAERRAAEVAIRVHPRDLEEFVKLRRRGPGEGER